MRKTRIESSWSSRFSILDLPRVERLCCSSITTTLAQSSAKTFLQLLKKRADNKPRPATEWTLLGIDVDEFNQPILPMQAAREPRDDVLDLAKELGLDLKQTCLLSLRLKGGPAFNKYGHATYLTGNGKSELARCARRLRRVAFHRGIHRRRRR